MYDCVFETVAIVGSQRSRSVSMERLGQTPRKEQKSIFDFLSPPSAEDAEKKEAAAALLKEAQEQRRKEKQAKLDELRELKAKWKLPPVELRSVVKVGRPSFQTEWTLANPQNKRPRRAS